MCEISYVRGKVSGKVSAGGKWGGGYIRTLVRTQMNKVLCTVALLGGLTAGEASANLIVNGSFEEPVIAAGFVVFNSVGQGIPGWTITSNDVDIDRNNVLGTNIEAHDGSQWIDLNGFSRGIIAQFFDTVVGQGYALRFFYADNPFNNTEGVEKTGNFTVRDDSFALIAQGEFSHSTTTGAGADWFDSGIIQFVAASASTRLAFSGDLDSGSVGVYLDSVSVTAVPEPATLSLIGLGLMGLWSLRGRHQSRDGARNGASFPARSA